MPAPNDPSLIAPDLTLLAVVERDSDIHPEYWRDAVESQKPLILELLVLDRRSRPVPPIPGFRSLHLPGPFAGVALRQAASECRGRAIALLGADGERLPGHLVVALKALDFCPGMDLVISDYELTAGPHEEDRHIRMDGLPDSPPPGWAEGALFRATSLQDLSPLGYFPVLLEHYRRMQAQGRLMHLPSRGYRFPKALFYERLEPAKAQARWLNQWTQGDAHHPPKITVILISHGSAQGVEPALESLCRQTLSPHFIQVVLVAEGPEGSISTIDPEQFPIRIDPVRRRVHGLAKALNKGLTQAVAPIVAFCEGSNPLAPQWAQEHLAAHSEQKGPGAVVLAPVLQFKSPTVLDQALNGRATDRLHSPLQGLTLANVSLPTRRLQAVGGFAPANTRRAMEMELALRLLQHGLPFYAQHSAVAYDSDDSSLESLQLAQRQEGRAQVDLCGQFPEAVDLLRLSELDLVALRERSEKVQRHSPRWLEAAHKLADVRPGELDLDRSPSGVGEGIIGSFTQLLERLCRGWQFEGLVDGLRAHAVADFGDLLRGAPLQIPGTDAAPWILMPQAQLEARWLGVLEGLIAAPRGRPIILWAHPETSYEPPVLVQVASALRRRASLRSERVPPEVFVLEPHPPRGRMIRLLTGAHGWLPLGGSAEAALTELAQIAELERHEPNPNAHYPSPWPLATQARLKLFAWPKWDDPGELDWLFKRYAALLLGRSDTCICLRLDPEKDLHIDTAVIALNQAFERCLGKESELEILIIDDALDDHAWGQLGQAIDATLLLSSSRQGARRSLLEPFTPPKVQNPMALEALLRRQTELHEESTRVRLLVLDPPPSTLSEHP